ncbi:Ldh family oxidoreductase [Paenarthrobacter sp. NPDC090522]|uniref:Ldh family oxidoreductase n=1 Tax=Paenarthrobacter sp. NPDC090522 TaxID=3364383 RepID=UPI00381D68F7
MEDRETAFSTQATEERITFSGLVAAIESTLLAAGADAKAARIMALNHAMCERDGALSHGVFRVPQYVETLASGYLDGDAEPLVEQITSSYIRVDAASGFAQVALDVVREDILKSVADQGVAVVAIRNSIHHSALWPDIEPFAEAGYFAFTTVTGGVPTVAPAGVRKAVLSTNPFAFASPVHGRRPLIVDSATSSMSFGDLTLAAKAGRAVAPGTGVDSNGRDTTDAKAIVEGGTLLPFGGHKGAALSIVVEILASALTGGDFSVQAVVGKPEGAYPSRTGQFLLVADPERGGNSEFGIRVAGFLQMLREAGMDRLPADHRYAVRAEAETRGIPITQTIQQLLAGMDPND